MVRFISFCSMYEGLKGAVGWPLTTDQSCFFLFVHSTCVCRILPFVCLCANFVRYRLPTNTTGKFFLTSCQSMALKRTTTRNTQVFHRRVLFCFMFCKISLWHRASRLKMPIGHRVCSMPHAARFLRAKILPKRMRMTLTVFGQVGPLRGKGAFNPSKTHRTTKKKKGKMNGMQSIILLSMQQCTSPFLRATLNQDDIETNTFRSKCTRLKNTHVR